VLIGRGSVPAADGTLLQLAAAEKAAVSDGIDEGEMRVSYSQYALTAE